MVAGEAGGRERLPRGMWVFAASIAVLVLVAVAGVWGILAFVGSEKERDMRMWQSRLGVVAEARQAAVAGWVERQFEVMRRLAENESLQLYMTEIEVGLIENRPADDVAAEVGYLRNLLVVTAEQTGFVAATRPAEVEANVQRAGGAGIALVDSSGKLIVASPHMPPSSPEIRAAIRMAASGQRALIDIHIGVSNEPMIGFVTPVYGIQATPGKDPHLGFVVGVRPLNKEFYDLLVQPGTTETSGETYLVRPSGATIQYLTPLADGTGPLKKTIDAGTSNLDAALAIEKPGGFGVRSNYAGQRVLVTGRKVPETPWTLVRTVSEAESLAPIERRANLLLTVFLSIAAGLVVVVIAVWRHGSSVRAARAAEAHRTMAQRLEAVLKLMRLVTDSQPAAVALVDGSDKFMFANRTAANWYEMDHPKSMLGKTMANVIGPVKAKAYSEINRVVLAKFEPDSKVFTFAEKDGDRIVKSEHIPVPGDDRYPPGVLMVMEDLTELTRERVRREQVLRQLVETLVAVVDRRDPFSADHSRRVREVASEVAGEMGLPHEEAETIAIASSLMNLGKILVPQDLLTKTEGLSDDERAEIRRCIIAGADFLQGVAFDGPVVETVRDIHRFLFPDEFPDAAGEVRLGAQVVAVANAFVGMTSARSWRKGMPIPDACGKLAAEWSGGRYDPRPIAALLNFVNNRNGLERWKNFAEAGVN